MEPGKKRIIVIGHVMAGSAQAAMLAARLGGDVEFMSATDAEKEFGVKVDGKEKSAKLLRDEMIREFDASKLVAYTPTDYSKSTSPIDAIAKKGRNGKRRW